MSTEAFDSATRPPGLRKRLSVAMSLIGGIRKDKKNPHGKYDYLSEEAVKRAVQDALITAEAIPEPRFEILGIREVAARNGGMRLLYDVKCIITIRDGEEVVKADGLGSGIDYDDKALMKAQTAAVREAWKNLFCIPSGTDPEAYPDEPRDDSAPSKPVAKPADKPEAPQLDVAKLTEIRKELGLSTAQVNAIAVKRFGSKVGGMDQAGIDELWAFLGKLQPEALEEVLNNDLSGIQKEGE